VQLVIAVVDEERTEELLAGFLELGVTGATVLQSEGMGRLLANEAPIFAGLEALRRARPRNHTLFSVMDGRQGGARDGAGARGVRALDAPRRIVFAVPVSRVEGCRGSWAGRAGAHVRCAWSSAPCWATWRPTRAHRRAPGRRRARGVAWC
jgi:hypothetical protein